MCRLRLLRMRARRAPGFDDDAKDVPAPSCLTPMPKDISADTLERILRRPGKSQQDGYFVRRCVTDEMARKCWVHCRQEDLNGCIRRNRHGHAPRRRLSDASKMLNAEQFGGTPDSARHRSLDSHTAFLFDKINFLMDATVGFINTSIRTRSSRSSRYPAWLCALPR